MLLCGGEAWWYQRDIATRLGVTPSSLQRELVSLEVAGILRRRKEGNRVYYQPDTDCPFLSELTGLLRKTIGIGDILRRALAPLAPKIDVAFVFGSVARASERPASDVDLFVVGEVSSFALTQALRKAEEDTGRSVNATVYASEELRSRVKDRNHFVREVLSREKLYVVGTEHELATALGNESR